MILKKKKGEKKIRNKNSYKNSKRKIQVVNLLYKKIVS